MASCARETARRLGPGDAIVSISSAASMLGSSGEYVHYVASNVVADPLTIGLSKELGPAGIRINTVSPGIIYIEFHATHSGEPGRPDRLGS